MLFVNALNTNCVLVVCSFRARAKLEAEIWYIDFGMPGRH